MDKDDYIESKKCILKIEQKEKEIHKLKLQVYKIMIKYNYLDYNTFIRDYRLK